ncbi:hypothetical protein [Flavobacterium sp. B17]|nr:hypothetical protein [Flavobacterium sp. B17]
MICSKMDKASSKVYEALSGMYKAPDEIDEALAMKFYQSIFTFS